MHPMRFTENTNTLVHYPELPKYCLSPLTELIKVPKEELCKIKHYPIWPLIVYKTAWAAKFSGVNHSL